MLLEDRPELTPHLSGVTGNFANDVTFEFDVVTRSIERRACRALSVQR